MSDVRDIATPGGVRACASATLIRAPSCSISTAAAGGGIAAIVVTCERLREARGSHRATADRSPLSERQLAMIAACAWIGSGVAAGLPMV